MITVFLNRWRKKSSRISSNHLLMIRVFCWNSMIAFFILKFSYFTYKSNILIWLCRHNYVFFSVIDNWDRWIYYCCRHNHFFIWCFFIRDNLSIFFSCLFSLSTIFFKVTVHYSVYGMYLSFFFIYYFFQSYCVPFSVIEFIYLFSLSTIFSKSSRFM